MKLLEVKLDKKSLMHDLMIMDYNHEDAENELNNHIEWIKSLPSTIKLYRIIYVDSPNEINVKMPGSHYSIDKDELIENHTYSTGYGELKYLITVNAKKSLINVQDTISNNILYPNEKEITLKNKGKGVEVVSIEQLSTDSILESENKKTSENLRQLLIDLVNKEGVEKAMEITGLNVLSLFDRIGKIEITPDLASILLYLLFKEGELPLNVNKFKLTWDYFDGVLYWHYKTDVEEFESMCTPFWDGRNGTPIELTYYTYIDIEGTRDEVELSNNQKYIYIDNEFKFNNIQDLINWYKEFYIPTCYYYLKRFIKEVRNGDF